MAIQDMQYVDVDDLSEESQAAYHELSCGVGIHSGEPWPWEVGVRGDNCTAEGWITREECDLIDQDLRKLGLYDGEDIELIKEW